MQRQRRLDGSPHTRHGASALRPLGPTLHLGEDKLSKGYSLNVDKDEDKKPHCDPDEIMKAYLEF